MQNVSSTPFSMLSDEDQALVLAVNRNGTREAAELLMAHPDATIARVLRQVNPVIIQRVLEQLDEPRREGVVAAAPPEVGHQWALNRRYPDATVGRLMNAPLAVFPPHLTVAEVVQRLREITKRAFITYGLVADEDGRLKGVVVMRELLLAEADMTLDQVMLREPFCLKPEMPILDAMKLVLTRHYPEYPVCDDEGRLIGLVRGQRLFEHQSITISAQAGTMVGVDREERVATPWARSLKFRHPWLHLNLLTAFIAAAVVGVFQDTIDRIVVLAVFLPVLAGQSGNTGCQALAVTIRGMTLGELQEVGARALVLKEASLGALNGALVGVSAGIAMFAAATMQGQAAAAVLGMIVFAAMTASCVISGVSGALVPLTLKKLGADPATASSIFLTTATDVASMGLLLGLATLLL